MHVLCCVCVVLLCIPAASSVQVSAPSRYIVDTEAYRIVPVVWPGTGEDDTFALVHALCSVALAAFSLLFIAFLPSKRASSAFLFLSLGSLAAGIAVVVLGVVFAEDHAADDSRRPQ